MARTSCLYYQILYTYDENDPLMGEIPYAYCSKKDREISGRSRTRCTTCKDYEVGYNTSPCCCAYYDNCTINIVGEGCSAENARLCPSFMEV